MSSGKPNQPRSKMSAEQRAKQFLPFSALPGLDEALEKIELEIELASLPEYEKYESAETNRPPE